MPVSTMTGSNTVNIRSQQIICSIHLKATYNMTVLWIVCLWPILTNATANCVHSVIAKWKWWKDSENQRNARRSPPPPRGHFTGWMMNDRSEPKTRGKQCKLKAEAIPRSLSARDDFFGEANTAISTSRNALAHGNEFPLANNDDDDYDQDEKNFPVANNHPSENRVWLFWWWIRTKADRISPGYNSHYARTKTTEIVFELSPVVNCLCR